MERGKNREPWVFDRADSYIWFLELGPLSTVNAKYLHGEVPSWNKFVEHPNNDSYWENEMCGLLPFISEPPVPALHVIGWFDAEDCYGPLKVYQKYERKDTKNWNYLVIGPWYHGSWVRQLEGKSILGADFGAPTSRFFRDSVQTPWFAYWLKDKGKL